MSELHTLKVERMSNSPDGIAHLDSGKTVFVSGVCPGDVIQARIVKEKSSFARAEMVSIEEPSPERVDAACPYAGQCGGCPWQQISYNAQLVAKRSQVADALCRIGGFDRIEVERLCEDTVASPRQWGYRNKMEFDFSAGDKPSLGMHAKAGDFLAIKRCLMLPKRHANIPKALTGAFRYLQGNSGHHIDMHRVGVRVSTHTEELEIALWSRPGTLARKSTATVLGGVHHPTSIVNVLCKEDDSSRKVSGVEVLDGFGCWHERLGDDIFAFSAPSFFQVNTDAAELLQKIALEPLAKGNFGRAFDLYSGAGTFTIPMTRLCNEVSAIESASSSVQDLKRNLRHCGCAARIIGGDVARELPGLDHPDVCLIDPPRAGLANSVIDSLCTARPSHLIYVSCDPATLARDLKLLCRDCFEIQSVTPVDLFPQTPHVETVCHMVAAGSPM